MSTESSLTIQDLRTIFKKITEGKAILFLGAGANKGCKNSLGEDAPSGPELAQIIRRDNGVKPPKFDKYFTVENLRSP